MSKSRFAASARKVGDLAFYVHLTKRREGVDIILDKGIELSYGYDLLIH